MDYSSVIFPAYEFRNLYTPMVDLDIDTCSNHDEEKIIFLKKFAYHRIVSILKKRNVIMNKSKPIVVTLSKD